MEEGRGQSLRFTQTIFNINLTAVIETDWYCSKLWTRPYAAGDKW